MVGNTAVTFLANAYRRLETMFPGLLGETKHNHYRDFGYPEHLGFPEFYGMYRRNGIARAGVDKTVQKTWQDAPELLEQEPDGAETGGAKETPLEIEIRKRLDDLRFWPKLADVDRRSLVGRYAGLILRFADNQPFSAPVTRVPGGLLGLVEIIPAWESQLRVSEWYTDDKDVDSYGKPKMFQFNEAAIGGHVQAARQLTIHPDRVLLWSRDGTIYSESHLEAGYNDLVDLEKISGAGGEGFWKNAKSAPVLEIPAEARLEEMARQMGVSVSGLVDKMNEQVDDFHRGFDKVLMLQGMVAKPMSVSLPSPEHFFSVSLQGFAASIQMPLKILIGSQTGQRASTEDGAEWSYTCMARRTNVVKPNVMALVQLLVRVGVLPVKEWFIDWTDLTEASIAEKTDRAVKMANANQMMAASGELVFTAEEIREVVNLEPLAASDQFEDEGAVDDEPPLDSPPAPGQK